MNIFPDDQPSKKMPEIRQLERMQNETLEALAANKENGKPHKKGQFSPRVAPTTSTVYPYMHFGTMTDDRADHGNCPKLKVHLADSQIIAQYRKEILLQNLAHNKFEHNPANIY